ncbi:MAG: hypothetical protein RL219_1654 [Actinomycetota bacterium]|jgi:hypothetical protein
MQTLVLLVVGAIWLVVLVPPLLRNRGESRPTSSVDHFRRNLAVLQQSAPPRINPLQSMGRPLTGTRQGLSSAYARAALKRTPTDPRLRRADLPLERRDINLVAAQPARPVRRDDTSPLERRDDTRAVSRREMLRRRREQTVRMLFTLSVTTAVLAFLAKSPALIYACAICVLSLFGYCAMLLRRRREADLYAAQAYRRAA